MVADGLDIGALEDIEPEVGVDTLRVSSPRASPAFVRSRYVPFGSVLCVRLLALPLLREGPRETHPSRSPNPGGATDRAPQYGSPRRRGHPFWPEQSGVAVNTA